MKALLRIALSAATALTVSTNWATIPVIEHIGAANPEDEGFTLQEPGNARLEPVIGDFGFDAWSIDVNSGQEFGFYTYFLSSSEQEATASLGWVMSARVRVLDVSNQGTMTTRFYTGTRRFDMRIGTDAFGQPFVRTAPSSQVGEEFRLENGSSGYHHYSLHYDPQRATADLYIDGIERITGLSGVSLVSDARVDFGTGQSIGHGHWNEFGLRVVPEPGTAALGIIGGGVAFLLGVLRRCRETRS